MFLLAGSAIYAPLINALTFIALINYMKLGAERIDALCKTPVLPEGIIEDVVNSEIEFRHVSFSYNADIPVLRDVSLTIPEKELTAFVGPSGSGTYIHTTHCPFLGCKRGGNPIWRTKHQRLHRAYTDATSFHRLSGCVSLQRYHL